MLAAAKLLSVALMGYGALSATVEDVKKLSAGHPSKYLNHQSNINYDSKNNTVASKSGGWVYYNQCDYQWANQRLGWCDQWTICTAGCAMSSAAMILATKGVGVNPSSLDDWLSNNGGYYDGCDLIWASIDAYGVTTFQGFQTADEGAICNGLSQGHGIVANVNNGEHWVLLTGCLGGGVFTVNDPAFARDTYGIWEIVMEAVYH
jgi:hypothetical protein